MIVTVAHSASIRPARLLSIKSGVVSKNLGLPGVEVFSQAKWRLPGGRRQFSECRRMTGGNNDRWVVAFCGVMLQVCMGTVYAWTYYAAEVRDWFGCSDAMAAVAFSLAIGFLGGSAVVAGRLLPRCGPRHLAVTGAVLYGVGYLLAAWALYAKWLWLFWLGFGVVGGIGLGFAYVTPVATVARWFGRGGGAVTGLVVMGFGMGSLVMVKVVYPMLAAWGGGDLTRIFLGIGVLLLPLGVLFALFLRNPEVEQPSSGIGEGAGLDAIRDSAEPVSTRLLVLLWLAFFLTIFVGIMFVSNQAGWFKELTVRRTPDVGAAALAASTATVVGLASLCNAGGRLMWAALSDAWGRVRVFRVILLVEAGVLAGLLFTRDPVLFAVANSLMLLCYGGGFGVLPSLVRDLFGLRRMPAIYGIMLTSWAAGGILGPLLAAFFKDAFGPRGMDYTLWVGLGLIVLALVLSAFIRPRRAEVMRFAGVV
jgi:OFA family oxalate/formate antiporter-like MFS transporter